MGDKGEREDIRKWMSPPASQPTTTTPIRRRRVMSTSDSEDERNMRPAVAINAQPSADDPPAAAAVPVAMEQPNVIDILSTSSDDMYIALPQRPAVGGNARSAIGSPSSVKGSNGQAAASTSQRNNRRTPRKCNGKRSRQNTISKFTADADETDDSDSSDSECDETDTQAQMLYHQAITGVRNANNARKHLHRSTINCPVCAKFAAYLQHFL